MHWFLAFYIAGDSYWQSVMAQGPNAKPMCCVFQCTLSVLMIHVSAYMVPHFDGRMAQQASVTKIKQGSQVLEDTAVSHTDTCVNCVPALRNS